MATVKELLEKRANVWEQAKALIDKAEAEGRDFTAEEQSQYEKMMNDMDELASRAKRLEQKTRFEAQMSEPINEPIKMTPSGIKEEKGNNLMPAFRSFLKDGIIRPELRALQVTGTDSSDVGAMGGYMVPPEQFIAELIKELDNAVFIRKLATVIPVRTSDSLGSPVLTNDMDDAEWTTEITNLTDTDTMSFGKRELEPKQLAKMIKVSMKLLRTSAIPVESLVIDRLAYKFAVTEEKAFLTGDGNGRPLGLFKADSNGISTNRDVESPGKITADSLIEAKYKINIQHRGNAQWIFHRDLVKEIAKLKDSNDQYLWRPGLALGQPDTLLNLPVNESEFAPNDVAADKYVGILGDFKYYWIAELMGMEIQRLSELFAPSSQVGFIGRMWVDGAPVLESAFARIKIVSAST